MVTSRMSHNDHPPPFLFSKKKIYKVLMARKQGKYVKDFVPESNMGMLVNLYEPFTADKLPMEGPPQGLELAR